MTFSFGTRNSFVVLPIALTLPEAAMLAGLLKAPSRYSPTNNIDLARERARIVLQNMVNAGYISQEEAHMANVAPASLEGYTASGSINYFVDWVAEALPDYAGKPDTDVSVITTIDPALQREAERIVDEVLGNEGAPSNVSQAALVAMTPDGAVRAMVGGRSYALSQFNRAVQAKRQPGSAFKPIVYLAALKSGYTPDSPVTDEPVSMGDWSPRNASSRNWGTVSLATALANSINTITVQVGDRVGMDRILSTAQDLGIEGPLPRNLSIALGSAEVTLLELTSAYSAFGNAGRRAAPYGIVSIEAENGETLYAHQATPEQVMTRNQAQDMTYMLHQVIAEGTGRNAALSGRLAAGKTGTSQDNRDAWFIGYTGNEAAGVWFGNDDNSPTKRATGGSLPARIWKEVMAADHQGLPVAGLPGVSDRPVRVAEPHGNPLDMPMRDVPAEGDPDRHQPPPGRGDGGSPLDLLNRIFGG